MSDIGVVIIGRNEGARLERCFASLGSGRTIVYVDSGSSDDSIETARQQGAAVVELDMATPFTAARARNAGLAAMSERCTFVQFIDGDCTLQPGWLDFARAALIQDPGLAAVFGRRREIAPMASIYNWMCDLEWTISPGETWYFGGDVMLRRLALEEVGRYPASMIAGEEPDLAIRLRKRGWRLLCLPHEMTLHDADILRFGQWWRRAVRSGHAFGELAARHGNAAFSDYRRRLAGVLWWGVGIPLAGATALALTTALRDLRGAGATGLIMLLPVAQLVRLTLREAPKHGWRRGLLVATFFMLAKNAQAIGAARYGIARLSGKRSKIIEYKGSLA